MVLSRVGNKYSLFIYKIWYQSFFNISTYECNYAHTFKIRNQMNRHYISIKVFFLWINIELNEQARSIVDSKGDRLDKKFLTSKTIFFPQNCENPNSWRGRGWNISVHCLFPFLYIFFSSGNVCKVYIHATLILNAECLICIYID